MGTNKRSGFTLVESSIVFVIIGLIVGGVLVGQDLIKAAYIRAQISQIEQFNVATNAFYGKYQALPGDMNYSTAEANGFATTDWVGGVRSSHVPGDGDGNGLIQGCDAIYYPYSLGCGEEGYFWSELTYANGLMLNLIPGSFGVPGGSPYYSFTTFDTDIVLSKIAWIQQIWPQAKIGNGNFIYVYSNNGYNYFGLSIIGLPNSGMNGELNTSTIPGITSVMAYKIDSKIEDGQPQSGRVDTNCIDNDYNPALRQANPASTGSYTGTTCYDSTTNTYVINSPINGNGASGVCALSFQFQ